MSGADYYKTLGVKPEASADEIKRAYRRLAREYHPDRTGGDKSKELRFKEISAAYDVLGDPAKREQYDAMRAGPQFHDVGAGGFGGFDLGDLFSQMFGGAQGGQGGRVRYTYTTGNGPGHAYGGDTPFDLPFGSGPRRARSASNRKPPAEQKVRASDGTLLLQRGADVHSDVRLRIDEAILGTVKEIATLEGTAKVKIPPGTSSGVKLRLKGKGGVTEGKRGDHFVTVQIDVPKKIDAKSEALLQQLMQRIRKHGD